MHVDLNVAINGLNLKFAVMNQRQKKKTSQNRKRHFEGLKAKEAKEAHASGAQRKQHKEQAKPHTPATESQHHNVVVS